MPNAEQEAVLADVVREHGGGQAVARSSGKIAQFWQGFGGQVLRGERSAWEVAAGFTGFADPMQGMFGGAGSIRDATHAKQLLREGFRPTSMLKRFPGQLGRQITQGASGMGLGAVAFGADIYLRTQMGESVTGATLRATGGTVGGAVGGAALGAVVGSIVPGLGTVVGSVVGGLIGYSAGEKTMDVGISGVNFLHDLGERSRRVELGGRNSAGLNTRAAYTMRSRALQQINRSGINMRSLCGREAQAMHLSGGPPQLAR